MKKEIIEQLPSGLKLQKMEKNFDLDCERECFSCFYDLHSSAVGCKCSPDRFACLKHADDFCSCEIEHRFVLLRYTMDELNTLIEALEGGVEAIRIWASNNFGFSPSSKIDHCGPKVEDLKRELFPMDSSEQKKSTSSSPRRDEVVDVADPCSPNHVSSEAIQSDSHLAALGSCASHASMECHNDYKDETHTVIKKAKVDWSIDLNIYVTSDDHECKFQHVPDAHDKEVSPDVKIPSLVSEQEKVYSLGAEKEPHQKKLRSNCDSHEFINKVQTSCQELNKDTGLFGTKKLFGVDIVLPCAHTKAALDHVLKTEVMNNPDVGVSVTDQSQEKLLDYHVEALNYGSIVLGRLWCTKLAIFPKGTNATFCECSNIKLS